MTETEFLNIDVDICGVFDLAPLLEALKPDMMSIHVDKVSATLEVALRHPQDVDDGISLIFFAYKRLDAQAAQLWQSSKVKFNIGIQSQRAPHMKEFSISTASLELVVEMRAELIISIYATPAARLAV
jgi:hypothetical protein